MSTLGLYFKMDQDEANALRDRLNKMAYRLGYYAERGPTAGEGNLADMLVALDRGDCQIRRVIWRNQRAEDVFDSLLGWGSIYPPADEDVAKAFEGVPERFRDAIETRYNSHGIDLDPLPPGEGNNDLPRWQIALHPDWSIDFCQSVIRALPGENVDIIWRACDSFASSVAEAVDRELVTLIGDDPTLGEGTRWDWDWSEGGYWVRVE